MIQRKIIALAALLVAIAVAPVGCSNDVAWTGALNAIRAQYPDVERITTDSLATWLGADSLVHPLLLDIRTPEEYAVSHLRDAIHIDPETYDFATLDTLPRDTPIVAYCSVGYRSSEAASRLMDAGFTNVMNLEGSIFRWANEGRPVYLADRRVHEVHPYNAAWGRLLDDDLHAN